MAVGFVCWIDSRGNVYQYLDRSNAANSYGIISPDMSDIHDGLYVHSSGDVYYTGGGSVSYYSYGRLTR